MTKGINILLVPIYTRYLSPKEYGIIDIFIILSSIVIIVFTFEITQALARYLQEERDKQGKILLTSTAFWFSVIGFIVFFLITFLFKKQLSIFLLGEDNVSLLLLAVLSLISGGIFYFSQNQLKWQLKPRETVIVSIINVLIVGSIAVLLLVYFRCGLKSVFIGQLIGNTIALFLAIYYSRLYGFYFSYKKLKLMLSYSFPLIFSGIGGIIALYIDRITIKELLNLHALGIYGVGYRFASVVGLVMIGFQQSLTPLIFKHYRDKNTPLEVAKIFNVFFVFAIFVFIGSIFFAKEVVCFLTTKEYYQSFKIIPILVLALFLTNMNIFTPGLGIIKKTKTIAFINIFSGVLNLLLNLLLVPYLGILGAAWATLLSILIRFFIYLYCSNKYYFIPYNWNKIILAFSVSVSWALLIISYFSNIKLEFFIFKIVFLVLIELGVVHYILNLEKILTLCYVKFKQ